MGVVEMTLPRGDAEVDDAEGVRLVDPTATAPGLFTHGIGVWVPGERRGEDDDPCLGKCVPTRAVVAAAARGDTVTPAAGWVALLV